LQDDGQGDVTTIFTSPYGISSSFYTTSEDIIIFKSIKKSPNQCRCLDHGYGGVNQLISFNTVTGKTETLVSNSIVSVVKAMKDYLLVSEHHKVRSRSRHPTNYYKIDKNGVRLFLGKTLFGERFSIVSTDTTANIIHIKVRNGTNATLRKITDSPGVGLEDE
jgi:hypothetical protein